MVLVFAGGMISHWVRRKKARNSQNQSSSPDSQNSITTLPGESGQHPSRGRPSPPGTIRDESLHEVYPLSMHHTNLSDTTLADSHPDPTGLLSPETAGTTRDELQDVYPMSTQHANLSAETLVDPQRHNAARTGTMRAAFLQQVYTTTSSQPTNQSERLTDSRRQPAGPTIRDAFLQQVYPTSHPQTNQSEPSATFTDSNRRRAVSGPSIRDAFLQQVYATPPPHADQSVPTTNFRRPPTGASPTPSIRDAFLQRVYTTPIQQPATVEFPIPHPAEPL